jgi:hypothetical protein
MGKEAMEDISANNVEYHTYFEEFAESGVCLLKALCLDTNRITKVKSQITRRLSIALPVRDKVGDTRACQELFALSLP